MSKAIRYGRRNVHAVTAGRAGRAQQAGTAFRLSNSTSSRW